MLRRRRGRSSSTRAAGLDELRAVGRWGPGERGDRGGDFFGCRRAVNADAAVRAHLPTQHEWALAAATGTLEPRLTPRTEDELWLDPLLANRARVVYLDALQERLFFERVLVQLGERLRRAQDHVDQQAGEAEHRHQQGRG